MTMIWVIMIDLGQEAEVVEEGADEAGSLRDHSDLEEEADEADSRRDDGIHEVEDATGGTLRPQVIDAITSDRDHSGREEEVTHFPFTGRPGHIGGEPFFGFSHRKIKIFILCYFVLN